MTLKMRFKILFALVFILVFCACPTSGGNATTPRARAEGNTRPELVDKLPSALFNYHYAWFHNYGDGLGFSLRYEKDSEKEHFADFYLWDAPSEMANQTHKEVVYHTTASAVQEIKTVEERGDYHNVEFIERLVYDSNGRIFTKHKMSMLRENLAVISFLYVTEYKGQLIKARISMPDNAFNRSREDVQQFVVEMFNRIIVAVDTRE